jgi:hypothetical protein
MKPTVCLVVTPASLLVNVLVTLVIGGPANTVVANVKQATSAMGAAATSLLSHLGIVPNLFTCFLLGRYRILRVPPLFLFSNLRADTVACVQDTSIIIVRWHMWKKYHLVHFSDLKPLATRSFTP